MEIQIPTLRTRGSEFFEYSLRDLLIPVDETGHIPDHKARSFGFISV